MRDLPDGPSRSLRIEANSDGDGVTTDANVEYLLTYKTLAATVRLLCESATDSGEIEWRLRRLEMYPVPTAQAELVGDLLVSHMTLEVRRKAYEVYLAVHPTLDSDNNHVMLRAIDFRLGRAPLTARIVNAIVHERIRRELETSIRDGLRQKLAAVRVPGATGTLRRLKLNRLDRHPDWLIIGADARFDTHPEANKEPELPTITVARNGSSQR